MRGLDKRGENPHHTRFSFLESFMIAAVNLTTIVRLLLERQSARRAAAVPAAAA